MLASSSQAALCLLRWPWREKYPSNLLWVFQSPLFLAPGLTYSKSASAGQARRTPMPVLLVAPPQFE